MTNLTQSLQEKAVKEFDKWFNHGTKDNPRFVYASGGYIEVRAFISSLVAEVVEETEKRVREEIYAKCQKEANKYFIDPLFPNIKVAVTEILLHSLTQPKEEND